MKCSTVLGDASNGDVLFPCVFDTSLLGLMSFCLSRPINYYYTYVRPPLTRYDTRITCWRWARCGVQMASIHNPLACVKSVKCY